MSSIMPPDSQYSINLANDVVTRSNDAVQDAPPVEPVLPTAASPAVPAIGVVDEIDTAPEDMAEVTMESRGLAREASQARERRAREARQRLERRRQENEDQIRRMQEELARGEVIIPPDGLGVGSTTAPTTIESAAPVSSVSAAPAVNEADSVSITPLAVSTTTRSLADPADAQAYLSTTNAPSVRDFQATFATAGNADAVRRFDNYMNLFTGYSATLASFRERSPEANMRAIENAYYRYFGISHYGTVTRALREGFSRAIERWYVGEGVFSPEMLGYSSADGFRFSPLSPDSQNALQYRTVLSSYDRNRIAQYLREMARLLPTDFMVYDPTGLEELRLEERRRFLQAVDEILREAAVEARAADLQYTVTDDNLLDIDALERQLDVEDQQRLDEYFSLRRDAYGQLLNTYQQLGLGIISASLR